MTSLKSLTSNIIRAHPDVLLEHDNECSSIELSDRPRVYQEIEFVFLDVTAPLRLLELPADRGSIYTMTDHRIVSINNVSEHCYQCHAHSNWGTDEFMFCGKHARIMCAKCVDVKCVDVKCILKRCQYKLCIDTEPKSVETSLCGITGFGSIMDWIELDIGVYFNYNRDAEYAGRYAIMLYDDHHRVGFHMLSDDVTYESLKADSEMRTLRNLYNVPDVYDHPEDFDPWIDYAFDANINAEFG